MKLSGLPAWARGWLVSYLIHRGGRNRMMRRLTGVVVDIVRSDDGVVRLLPADRQLVPDAVGERQRLRLPEKQKNRVRAQKALHHSSSSGLPQIQMQRRALTRLFARVLHALVLPARCLRSSPLKLFIWKRVQIKPKHSNAAEWTHSNCFYPHSLSGWKLLQQQEEEEGDSRKAGCVGGWSLSLITIGGNRPATFHRRWWRIAWRFPGQPLDLKAPWLTLNIKNPTWTHNNHVTVSYSPLHSPAVHEVISGHQPEESCPLKTHFIFYNLILKLY